MIVAESNNTTTRWDDPAPYIGSDHNQPDLVVGAGPGLLASMNASHEALRDRFRTARSVVVPIEERFERLAKQWKEETMFLSSPEDIARNPSYQRIIDMGRPAVPLLLGELAHKPDHWFGALRAITGENPVDPSDAGHIAKMAKAWVDWGRADGFTF